jgi:pyrroline-5-carboxylate reductase
MKKIGFIGAGNMAEALVKGLLSSGLFKNDRIIMSDVVQEKLDLMSSLYGVEVTQRNPDVVEFADFIVLAVKPNLIRRIMDEIGDYLTPKKILISIAAGIPVDSIMRGDKGIKLVRAMPNTPALVLAGASALYCVPSLTQEEREDVKRIFDSVGITYIVESEELLDAVTGLSGSGPAFVAIFIEALADGGVKMGLPRDIAIRLAAQTAYGTARMILDGGMHPAELKDRVSSPSGTTIEGIKEIEVRGLRGIVISSVEAAARRSKELSKEGKK